MDLPAACYFRVGSLPPHDGHQGVRAWPVLRSSEEVAAAMLR
jgi:hypothetical protein